MNQQDKDDAVLSAQVRQALDEEYTQPDQLTRAALRAARHRALDQLSTQPRGIAAWLSPRWSLAALGTTCAIVLAWGLQSTPSNSLEVASNQAEDAAVIADLDLVMWLEEGDV